MVGRPMPKNHPGRNVPMKSQVSNSNKQGGSHVITPAALERITGKISPYEPPVSEKRTYKDYWNIPESNDVCDKPEKTITIQTVAMEGGSQKIDSQNPLHLSIEPDTQFREEKYSKNEPNKNSALPLLTKKPLYRRQILPKMSEASKIEELQYKPHKDIPTPTPNLNYPEPPPLHSQLHTTTPSSTDTPSPDDSHAHAVSRVSTSTCTLAVNEGSAIVRCVERGDRVGVNKSIAAVVKAAGDKEVVLAYANSDMCTLVNLQTDMTKRAIKHGMDGKLG